MSAGKIHLKEAYNAILQNDYQKAIEAFHKAIRSEPNNASYYYKLSITYSRNGEIVKALESAKRSCDLQPNIQLYRYHLQILQAKSLVLNVVEKMENGNLTEEIEEILIQAKKLDPLNVEAYLLFGIYYGEKNFLKLAIKEFNSVISLDPVNQQARQLMAYYMNFEQKGDNNE